MRARTFGTILLAALPVVYLVAFATSTGRRIDAVLFGRVAGADLDSVRQIGHRALDTIDIASLVLAGIALVVVGLARGRGGRAAAAGIVLVGSLATTELLKAALGPLDRRLAPNRGSEWEGSFPSGHATIAMSLALAAVLVAPRALRPAAAVAGSVYAAAVGVSLVALGWHYPSDVVGGFLVASLWCAAALVGLRAWGERADGRFVIGHERVGLVLGALLALAFAVVLVAALVTHPAFVDALRLRRSFVATGTALGLLSMALVGGVTALAPEPVKPRP